MNSKLLIIFFIGILNFNTSNAQDLPSGFVSETIVNHNAGLIGIEFDSLGRAYTFEKSGKLWFIKNDNISSTPFLDISFKTAECCESGLQGFALDPQYLQNGYIYLAYVLKEDSIPDNQPAPAPSVGRISRFTVMNPASPNPTVDINSEFILIGSNFSNGWPITYIGHVGGALAFGTDGSLLFSAGDGASFGDDNGSDPTSFFQKSLDIGIITWDQNIGSLRAQELNSLSGKILRIDKNTGLGLPDNPYYDGNDPGSNASKTYARGLRNPWKLLKIPHTGSISQPGKFLIGDVGTNIAEEVNILENPGENFGWPYFEGIDFEDTNRPPSPPAVWKKPVIAMRDATYGNIHGNKTEVGTISLPGDNLSGNASIVIGDFYHDFASYPEIYHDNLFFGDFVSKNIYRTKFDANYNPEFIYKFGTLNDQIAAIRTSPVNGDLYVCVIDLSNSTFGQIIRIKATNSNSNPISKILLPVNFGSASYIISPDASLSYDPNPNDSLSYHWELSDGQSSTGLKPYFKVGDANNLNYNFIWLKLKVVDSTGAFSQDSLKIHFNTQKPIVDNILADPDLNEYVDQNPINTAQFTAAVINPTSEPINYKWEVYDSHNGHRHLVNVSTDPQPNFSLPNITCESGASYWALVRCTITSDKGLSDTKDLLFSKNCWGTNQTLTFTKPSDTTYNVNRIKLTASATSLLPITFFITSGPGSIYNDSLQFISKPGIVTIRATQHGQENVHNISPYKEQSLIVRKPRVNQSLTYNFIPSANNPASRLKLNGTTNTIDSVRFLVISGPAHIIGDSLIIDTLGKEITLIVYVAGTDELNFGFIEKKMTTCFDGINLTISTTNIDNPLRSKTVIISNQQLIDNWKYFAGNGIELLPGFKTQVGSVFEAKIAGCDEN